MCRTLTAVSIHKHVYDTPLLQVRKTVLSKYYHIHYAMCFLLYIDQSIQTPQIVENRNEFNESGVFLNFFLS